MPVVSSSNGAEVRSFIVRSPEIDQRDKLRPRLGQPPYPASFDAWLLEQAGLPTPRTIVAEQFEDALSAFEVLGGDVVVVLAGAVVDEQGNRVGPGVIGELVIRGANVMRGYWGKPKERNP